MTNFEEQFQVLQARFRSLQFDVWNTHLAALTSGALGVKEMENVSKAAQVLWVICDLGIDIVGRDTFADMSASVDRFVYHNDLILPAFGFVCFQITVFFYFA